MSASLKSANPPPQYYFEVGYHDTKTDAGLQSLLTIKNEIIKGIVDLLKTTSKSLVEFDENGC